MRKIDTVSIFVSPSIVSGSITLIGAAGLLLITNASFLQNGGFINTLLLGQTSDSGLIAIAEQTRFELSELTLGNPLLNKILFFLFWMMVGLVVYIIINTIGQTISMVTSTIEEQKYFHARKTQIQESFWLRSAVRLAAIIGLLFFYGLFISFIMPFSTLAAQAWLGGLQTVIGWFYGGLGFIVLVLALHVFAVLFRLIALRPRLFGGWGVFA